MQHVVAEVHDEVVVAKEVLSNEYAMGEPKWRILWDVSDLHSKLRAIADGGADFGPGVAGNDANFRNSRFCHGFNAIEKDGFIGNGHQLLGAGVGNWPQSRASATGKNEALH